MYPDYHRNPILGMYYYPRPDRTDDVQISHDLDAIAAAHVPSIWLFYDPFYESNSTGRLRLLLNRAQTVGLTVVPVLGQFLQLDAHPEVKIVNADGTTSDNPRFWNMGCFRHPTVIQLATERAVAFFRDFGDHPALYRLDAKPVISVAHEAYYRNSIPEFGGGPMMPNCYCDGCRDAFRDYLAARGLDAEVEPPRDASDPVLWQHWLNCHAEAIPAFLTTVIQAVNAQTPVLATHECNDFYPASWQSVYTGNDWWRMGATLDFGHEDMYPLEFDHRYQCYVYDYAKDILRSATGFDRLVTGNGQAFDSWAGYRIPEGSMSEQIYSCLAHGALGLVWWGMWRSDEPDERYRLLYETRRYNDEYRGLIARLDGFRLAPARIALLYSWTTMSQALNDDHSYDTLLTYMLLVQAGYPVDILSEEQVAAGLLAQRGYRALGVMGGAALPDEAHAAIAAFADSGGLVLADHAPTVSEGFAPAFADWRGEPGGRLRQFTLPDGLPVPVELAAAPLNPPPGSEILARFETGAPAICRIPHGAGSVILAGSYLGWDYTTYPGYYDLAAMFPFHTRRDDALRDWLAGMLTEAGIVPPARSTHPDVEVAVWQAEDSGRRMLLVINHLCEPVTTQVSLTADGDWSAREALTDQPAPLTANGLAVSLGSLEGRAYWLERD